MIDLDKLKTDLLFKKKEIEGQLQAINLIEQANNGDNVTIQKQYLFITKDGFHIPLINICLNIINDSDKKMFKDEVLESVHKGTEYDFGAIKPLVSVHNALQNLARKQKVNVVKVRNRNAYFRKDTEK